MIYPSTSPSEAGLDMGFASIRAPGAEPAGPPPRPSLLGRVLGFLLRYLGTPE